MNNLSWFSSPSHIVCVMAQRDKLNKERKKKKRKKNYYVFILRAISF